MKFRGPKPDRKVDLDSLQTQTFRDKYGNLYSIEQYGMDRGYYEVWLIEEFTNPVFPIDAKETRFERSELKEIFGIE